jgi:Ca2+-binding EF-hand superfamily protein
MFKEIFSEVFDKDGDGVITKEKFRTRIGQMASMMIQLGRLGMLGCATIHDELNEVEADAGNSTIDFAKFLSIMNRKLTSPLPLEMTSPAVTDVDM